MPFNKLTNQDIDALRAICGEARTHVGEAIHSDFTHDEMTEYGCFAPEILLEALSTDEVAKIMAYATERNLPVTPRGSGTGLCGGAVPIHGGILLSLAKMDKIIEFDEENLTVTLEPGVLLMDLAQAAIDRDMMYPLTPVRNPPPSAAMS